MKRNMSNMNKVKNMKKKVLIRRKLIKLMEKQK